MKLEINDRRSAKDRVIAMLSAYQEADADADIEIRAGTTAEGEAALMLSIGETIHVFTDEEAQRLIAVLDRTIAAYPSQARAAGVVSLRDGIAAGRAALESQQ